MSAQGDVILNLNALEGSAQIEGQTSEILAVKTAEGTERIKLDSAFQLKTTVRYDVPKKKAEAIEEDANKSGTGQ
jgi:hypothetical protein